MRILNPNNQARSDKESEDTLNGHIGNKISNKLKMFYFTIINSII